MTTEERLQRSYDAAGCAVFDAGLMVCAACLDDGLVHADDDDELSVLVSTPPPTSPLDLSPRDRARLGPLFHHQEESPMSHGYYRENGTQLAVASFITASYGRWTDDGLRSGWTGLDENAPTCPDCCRKLAAAAAKRTQERIETARRKLERTLDAPTL